MLAFHNFDQQLEKQFFPICIYIYVIDEKGKCFYNEHSWFVHKNYHKGKNEVKNKNKEVFEKIFGMMDDIKP